MLSEQERERLILENQGICVAVANDMYRQLGGPMRGNWVLDDLIGWARLGMVEAATRYKPGHGASFATFARWRVKGKILDEIRGSKYWADAGSEPIKEYHHPRAADAESNPLEGMLTAERRAIVGDLLATLSAREARIVRMKYFDDVPGDQIASEFGISINRFWQVLHAALLHMAQAAHQTLGLEARAVIGDMPVCRVQRADLTILPAGSRPWCRSHSTPTTPAGASGICRSVMRRAA